MSRIDRVCGRDGAESSFDEERIVRSIYTAAKAAGKADIVVARELAGVVTLFLERRHWEKVPHVEDIQDMVERVLLETGHVEVARAYIRARQVRPAGPQAPPAPRPGSLFPEATVVVSPATGEGVSMWDRARIERALEREASLPPDTAQAIAEAVEARILGGGVERISSGLIRSLVDAEMFVRGFADRISSQAVVGVPGYDLKRWIEGAELPSHVTRQVAERALSEFAFSEVYSRDVGSAHAAGRIHVVGAQYPLLLHSIYFPLEFVKRFGDLPLNPEKSAVPEDLADLQEALRRVVADVSRYVFGFVDVGYLNLMTAPLLGDADPYSWAGSVLGALETPGPGIPPVRAEAELMGGVPDFLRFTDAVGPGGIRVGRGYQEFWTDAERLTRALVDAMGRDGQENLPGLNFHVDRNTFRNPSSLSLVRGICAEVARGLPLTFVFEREGSELKIHSRYLTKVEDPAFFRNPESTRIPYVQMVVLNAAQAAYRAGRGNLKGFTDELEAALALALKAHSEKARFLQGLTGEYGGPLKRLSQIAPDGKPFLDVARGEYLVSICGFPEAVAFLSGGNLASGGDALKMAGTVAPFLTLKANEDARKAGLRVSLAGPAPAAAARRLFEADRASFPRAVTETAPEGYRPGLLLKEEMPHDLLPAVRIIGSLYSLIEPCVTIGGLEGHGGMDSEGLFDLVCEVFERTEMTFLRFRHAGAQE